MPEGDTVWKIAHTLRPRLVDRELVEVQLRGRRSQVVPERPVVQSVEPVGKHLLVRLGRSAMLRVHLGLHGRWRLGRPGTVPGPRRRLSVLLATEDDVCACFGARSVEVFGAGLRSQHPVLSSLGPDLLVDPVPWDVVAERAAAATAARSISALLLDQRVAAGIGNVYRNEVLFLHGLHPDTPAVTFLPSRSWRCSVPPRPCSGRTSAPGDGSPPETLAGSRGAGRVTGCTGARESPACGV